MPRQPTRQELLELALGVLPPLPLQIDVLSEDGGSFLLGIFDREGELLHAFGPRERVRRDLHMLARITDEARGRYELEFEVADVFFHSGAETLLHVAVSGVRHRKMRRAAPRVAVAEPAVARVVFCRTLPRDSEVDVRTRPVQPAVASSAARSQRAPTNGVRARLRGDALARRPVGLT